MESFLRTLFESNSKKIGLFQGSNPWIGNKYIILANRDQMQSSKPMKDRKFRKFFCDLWV